MHPHHHHHHRRRLTRAVALAAAFVAVAAGCSSSDDSGSEAASASTTVPTTTTADAAPSTLDVTSRDFAYALGSDTVPAGLVTVTQQNEGSQPHQVTLIRLEDGQTADQLATALAEDGEAAAAPENYAGGPNAIQPGGDDEATVELAEGDYALICFIPSSDRQAHFEKGMVAALTVGPAAGPTAAPPETDGTIHMADYSYVLPDDFTGQGTYAVVNDGPQVHELTVSTGADGATGGGLAAIAPGATGYLSLDVADGYSFVCFVSDEESGAPHFTLGMSVPISLGDGDPAGASTTSSG